MIDIKLLKILFCMIVFLILISCNNKELPYVEVARINSPDGKVDAVVIRKSGDATTSISNELYILPKGGNVKDYVPSMIGDHFNGIEVLWFENKFLKVRYQKGRIFSYSNFWHSKKMDNFSYVIEIRLEPPKDIFSLSKNDRWIIEKP